MDTAKNNSCPKPSSLPKRRSIRVQDFDYSQPGAYFVTICTHNKRCLFGNINDGRMILNQLGLEAKQCWENIPEHFPHVSLDAYVVMPNHIHGILIISEKINAATGASSTGRKRPHGTSKTLGSVVRGFKIGVSKWIRKNTEIHELWQRNYFERIIRTDKELVRFQDYIIDNPMQWEMDRENPDRVANQSLIAMPPWE
jgi:REP element-mobilizing transposase RayT